MELKLSDIVSIARLNLWTAQHILKHAEYLQGMPESGSQGLHRRFTLDQATRLSICTLLVMWGIPLKQAGAAVDFCEKEVRTNPKSVAKPLLLGKFGKLGVGHITEILIIDREYLTLRRDAIKMPQGDRMAYSIIQECVVTLPPRFPLTTLSIDLNALRLAMYPPSL